MIKDDSARKLDTFFDNLVPVSGLLVQLDLWLGKSFHRNTVYKWVKEGMPAVRIRGDLYFSRDEVALWLQRTAKR